VAVFLSFVAEKWQRFWVLVLTIHPLCFFHEASRALLTQRLTVEPQGRLAKSVCQAALDFRIQLDVPWEGPSI